MNRWRGILKRLMPQGSNRIALSQRPERHCQRVLVTDVEVIKNKSHKG